MSDNSEKMAVNNECEVASSDKTTEDIVAGEANGVTDTSAEPICEQGEIPTESPKKKVSVTDIRTFARNKVFTPKACNITLILLGSVITVLCLLQMVLWGLTIKDTYLNYWEAIKTLDFINIGVMALMVLFVLVLLINTIKGVVSLIEKRHETRFETVSTMFAFCVFSMFVTKLFDGQTLLISDFTFSPILKILIALTIAYAVVRLSVKDFATRICPFAFSCGAIFLVILMFSQNIGNFATYTIDGSLSFNLAGLNMYKYIQSALGLGINTEAKTIVDSLFFEYGNTISFSGTYMDETIVMILLQFVPIMVANVLPYVAISMLGYLMYGLVDRNYMQYYNLQSCKKVSVTMLVVSIISLTATICLHFICKADRCSLAVQINYVNVIVTVLFCVLLIIVTSLPWKIYNVIYRHRYIAYQKIEGSN